MIRRRIRALHFAALTSAAVIGLSLVGAPPASAGGNHDGSGSSVPKVIASGLDNPRQLSFTKSGDLLVAEAGEGGTGPCVTGPEGGTVCFGTTGAVTKISSHGKQSRILTGLPSLAEQGSGAQAAGPSDVAAEGRRVTVLIGLGANPAIRADLPPAGKRLGTLAQTTGHGGLRTIADLAGYEATHNPVDDPDSNPVGLLKERNHYVVADAGGNTVLRVSDRGRIRLIAQFEDRPITVPGLPPNFPMQAVPTSVATKGWDGAYYVSQLTGFPFPQGAANIYRVDPRTGRTTVYAAGLTNVTDLTFDGRTLYAVQISAAGLQSGPIGSVVKVRPGGAAPSDHAVVAENLFAPYGISIRGGSAYVTVGSVAKDDGQVIKIRL